MANHSVLFRIIVSFVFLFSQSVSCEVYWKGASEDRETGSPNTGHPLFSKIIEAWGAPVTIKVYKSGDKLPALVNNKMVKQLERKLNDGRVIRISYEKALEAHLFAKP